MNRKSNKNKHARRLYVLIVFMSLFFNSFGQLVFEEGYLIDNNGKRVECWIKNYEWRLDPLEIEYRHSQTSAPKFAVIQEIQEFQVANFKYQRFTLLVDQSSMAHSNLSKKKEPEFLEETLFLRVLVEGKATLYASGKHQRYFFAVDSSRTEQLIYKEYIFESSVETNNSYKSQLWQDLSCDCLNVKDIDEIDYNKKELIRLFERYNICFESNYINYGKSKKKVDFNLIIRPGFRLGTFTMSNAFNYSQNVDFGWQPSFSFGLEAELVIPFNKNKWSFIFVPTYQYYKAEDPRENYNNPVDYKSIELPVGIKYKMFLSPRSALFLSAVVVVIDIPINSSIGYLDVNSTHNLIFGFGYAYNNRFSAEIRYSTRRSLVAGYTYYSGDYNSFDFIIGYRLF